MDAHNDGDSVTLRGTDTTPGSARGDDAEAADSAGRNGSSGGSGTSGFGTRGSGTGNSGAAAPVDPDAIIPRDGYTVNAPVTLADLVNFHPTAGVDQMEPNGWMIVGLNTNFFATASTQVQTGLLLGRQASVRFTPVRYHWAYGDGATRSSTTPGTTWKAQHASEFDPTATSHVYRSPGTYSIDLSVDFTAEYRYLATEWIPISGVLNIPANRLTATAGQAKTVLVNHECTVAPTAPGC